MSEVLIVRRAEETDFPAVQHLEELEFRLHQQARPDYFKALEESYTRQELRELLALPCPIAWVAERGGQVVGLCFGRIDWTPGNEVCKPRKVAFLQDLSTLPDHRGQGIGTALLRRAREQAVAEGAESLELTVWAFNKRAVALYERMGLEMQYHRMEQRLTASEGDGHTG